MVLNNNGKGIVQVAACSPSLAQWLTANTNAIPTRVKDHRTRKGVSQARELRYATSTSDKGKYKNSGKDDEGKDNDKGVSQRDALPQRCTYCTLHVLTVQYVQHGIRGASDTSSYKREAC